MESPKVSIVILNWNGWKDTIECLESLYQINYQNYNVIIIDNNSENNSLEMIKKYCNGSIGINSKFFEYNKFNKPLQVIEYTKEEIEGKKTKFDVSNKTLILIKNDANYGFTEGNNIGIHYAIESLDSDYILLLNNDTVVTKNFLSEMVDLAKSDDSIGFVGAKTYYYDYNPSSALRYSLYINHPLNYHYHYKKDITKNFVQSFGGKENMWSGNPKLVGNMQIDEGQFNENKTVDFIHGACILTKKELIKEIGYLDSKFFSYREENDWCIRGWEKGWKSLVSYKAVIWHKGGKSTSSTKFKPLSTYYMTRNRFLFMKKHANRLQSFSFILYFFAYNFWFQLLIYIIRPFPNKSNVIKSFLKATKDGFFMRW